MLTDPILDPIFGRLRVITAKLIEVGRREDALMDSMLTVTMCWVLRIDGPREESRRLYLLAMQAAAVADQLDRDREGRAR